MNESNSTAGFITRLPELALIAVKGEERIGFLQGLLTNDMRKLTGELMVAGFCTPKGRLMQTPRLTQQGDTVYIIAPADNIAAFVKRLSMYILRSKVTVEKSSDYTIAGIIGCTPALPEGSVVLPQHSAAVQTRVALALPEGRALALVKGNFEDTTTPATYWSASAAAGDPWVFAAAAERFVPQAINLELAGGVSFTKGCYMGQEIVSRIEHIGKTNRRTALFAADKELDTTPGQDLENEAGEIAGTVLYSAQTHGRTVMLVEVTTQAAESDSELTVKAGTLHCLPLPYGYSRT